MRSTSVSTTRNLRESCDSGLVVAAARLYAARVPFLRDPHRECHCILCDGDDGHQHEHVAGHRCADGTPDHVRKFGWSSVGIAPADGVPPWAFSVGLWHSLGSPEVAIFGLRNPDMQQWINTLAGQVKAGQALEVGDALRYGVLPNEFPVMLRSVHRSWYPSLFGTALHFYNHRPPLPFVQIVWPDRDGRFPWEQEAGENCRANQPHLWLPVADHPRSPWTASTRSRLG